MQFEYLLLIFVLIFLLVLVIKIYLLNKDYTEMYETNSYNKIFDNLYLGNIDSARDLEFIKKFSDRTPISRLAEAHELKSSLRYLLDPENTYITGQNINVDGGYQLW